MFHHICPHQNLNQQTAEDVVVLIDYVLCIHNGRGPSCTCMHLCTRNFSTGFLLPLSYHSNIYWWLNLLWFLVVVLRHLSAEASKYLPPLSRKNSTSELFWLYFYFLRERNKWIHYLWKFCWQSWKLWSLYFFFITLKMEDLSRRATDSPQCVQTFGLEHNRASSSFIQTVVKCFFKNETKQKW